MTRTHRTAFFLSVTLSAFMALMPMTSFAIGDAAVVAELVKNLDEMKQQYNKLEAQYDVMQQQLQRLHRLEQDAEGHYGYGHLLNSAADLKRREWSPSTWQDALKGLSGNNPSRYQQLLRAYKANHPTLSKQAFEKGSTAANATAYESEVRTNQAAAVNSSYAFDTIETHLKAIHTLSLQIDKTKNVKGAIDLNSRLLTEMANAQQQILKTDAVLSEQMATSRARTLAGETAAARFDQ